MSVRVCFVCLGNICRSPTAEAIFRHLVNEAGLAESIVIDSAGTIAYHAGEPPDRRSTAAARARGFVLEGRARRIEAKDFARFDYIIAMDGENHRNLLELAPDESARSKVHLLRDFVPDGPRGLAVPDPYYGGERGFEDVLDICEEGCKALLAHVRAHHDLEPTT